MRKYFIFLISIFICISSAASPLKAKVDNIIIPFMKKHHIPGLAVGITVHGKDYYFNYGVKSLATNAPVTKHTLFEIASITKTFTTTLAAILQTENKINIRNRVSDYFPSLKGTVFDNVTLLNLATHTSGLPISNKALETKQQLIEFFKKWQGPKKPIGRKRIYSNLGIQLLGMTLAMHSRQSYPELLREKILVPLKMTSTFIKVPKSRLHDYAMGYNQAMQPVRLPQDMLMISADGIRTTSRDMIKYLKANMGLLPLTAPLKEAFRYAHTGYYKIPGMIQDLGWDQLPLPLTTNNLMQVFSSAYLNAAASVIKHPTIAEQNAVFNKTGMSSGFVSYTIFVPKQQLGIVLLANKAIPTLDKVLLGREIYQVLQS